MRRHTIAGLMLMVLACALAVAALRYASEFWVTVVLATTLALLGCSVFGVAYRTGACRAGWLGFLVFGGGYVALAFTPWGGELKTNLPFTRMLVRLDEAMHPAAAFEVEAILLANASGQPAGTVTLNPSAVKTSALTWGSASLGLLAPSGQREHFLAVGHGLCALMLGLFGMIIARRFQGTSREMV
jgi:hypothetical protein